MSCVVAVEKVYQESAWWLIGSLPAKEEEPAEKEEEKEDEAKEEEKEDEAKEASGSKRKINDRLGMDEQSKRVRQQKGQTRKWKFQDLGA